MGFSYRGGGVRLPAPVNIIKRVSLLNNFNTGIASQSQACHPELFPQLLADQSQRSKNNNAQTHSPVGPIGLAHMTEHGTPFRSSPEPLFGISAVLPISSQYAKSFNEALESFIMLAMIRRHCSSRTFMVLIMRCAVSPHWSVSSKPVYSGFFTSRSCFLISAQRCSILAVTES